MAGIGNALPKKPMGIQFVKSSETLNPDKTSAVNSDNVLSTSSPKPLLSLPTSAPTQPIQSQFGGPAVNFTPKVSGNFQSRPPPSRYNQSFVKAGDNYTTLRGGSSSGRGYRMPGLSHFNHGVSSSNRSSSANTFQKVPEAQPVCSVDAYLKAWKEEKDPVLSKLRKLAYEVTTLKSDRPNAKDKLHSAANRVPLRIEFNTEPKVGARGSRSFLCYVYIESISIASGQGAKMKAAKTNAYEAALQKVLMPFLRVVPVDPTSKELQVSKEPFTSPPPQPSKVPLNQDDVFKEGASQHKESNLEAAGLKRRYNEYKKLDEFVIVEPKVPIPDCTSAHTLRRSADFNHMLLEYEYFFKGESARCVLRIENEVLADVNGVSKNAAKNIASAQALLYLKKFCWIIKTKQAVDSNTKISKEEIVNELNEQSDSITNDNIGNKMLRKMGWSGGGVGKDGDGIAEPVSLRSVLNREGLGLGASKGVTDDYRKRIKDVIENYAASENQEDLVFSSDFRLEERQIIHDECRRLNLRSKSKGKGMKRYLCVRRKRSVNQLFDHLMSVGGETARYQLVPPGRDVTHNQADHASSFQTSNTHHASSENKALSSGNSTAFNNQNEFSFGNSSGNVGNGMTSGRDAGGGNQHDRNGFSRFQQGQSFTNSFPNQPQSSASVSGGAVGAIHQTQSSASAGSSFGVNRFQAGNFGNSLLSNKTAFVPEGNGNNSNRSPSNNYYNNGDYHQANGSRPANRSFGGNNTSSSHSTMGSSYGGCGGNSNSNKRPWNQASNFNANNSGGAATPAQNRYQQQQTNFASSSSSNNGAYNFNNPQQTNQQIQSSAGNGFFNFNNGSGNPVQQQQGGMMMTGSSNSMGMGMSMSAGGSSHSQSQGYGNNFPLDGGSSNPVYNNTASTANSSWNQPTGQWAMGQGQGGAGAGGSSLSSNGFVSQESYNYNFSQYGQSQGGGGQQYSSSGNTGGGGGGNDAASMGFVYSCRGGYNR